MSLFDCDYVVSMDEYARCKIDCEDGRFAFTQPVMLQIFKDDFVLPLNKHTTPGESVATLDKSN